MSQATNRHWKFTAKTTGSTGKILSTFFRLQPGNGSLGNLQAGFQNSFFVVAHEHLIFEEARATGGARRILLARPLHMLKLFEQAETVFQQMLEGYFVRGFTAEKEVGEKIIFGEAFGHILFQPAIEFGLSRGSKPVYFAIGPAFLHNYLRLDQSCIAQTLERGINLAVAGVPVTGQSPIKCLFDIVATHGSRAQQAQDDMAERIA